MGLGFAMVNRCFGRIFQNQVCRCAIFKVGGGMLTAAYSIGNNLAPPPAPVSAVSSSVVDPVPVFGSFTSDTTDGPSTSEAEPDLNVQQVPYPPYNQYGNAVYQNLAPDYGYLPPAELGYMVDETQGHFNAVPFMFECIPPANDKPLYPVPEQEYGHLSVPGSSTQPVDPSFSQFNANGDLNVDPGLLAELWNIMDDDHFAGGSVDQGKQVLAPEQWAVDPAAMVDQWANLGGEFGAAFLK